MTTETNNALTKSDQLALLRSSMTSDEEDIFLRHGKKLEITKHITNIVAANGIFKAVKTPMAIFYHQKSKFDEKVDSLDEIDRSFDLLIPKLPFESLVRMRKFYQAITDKDTTESQVSMYYNHNNIGLPDWPGVYQDPIRPELVYYAPVQENTSTLTKVTDETKFRWFIDNMQQLVSCHSHNNFGAFASGTDDANEHLNSFYLVSGENQKGLDFSDGWSNDQRVANDTAAKTSTGGNSLFASFIVDDKRTVIKPYDLFEWPTYKSKVVTTLSYTGSDTDFENVEDEDQAYYATKIPEEMFADVTFPEDWLKQHSKPVYSAPSYVTAGRGWYQGGAHGKRATYPNYGLNDDVFGGDSLEPYYGNPMTSKKTGSDAFVLLQSALTEPEIRKVPKTGVIKAANTYDAYITLAGVYAINDIKVDGKSLALDDELRDIVDGLVVDNALQFEAGAGYLQQETTIGEIINDIQTTLFEDISDMLFDSREEFQAKTVSIELEDGSMIMNSNPNKKA